MRKEYIYYNKYTSGEFNRCKEFVEKEFDFLYVSSMFDVNMITVRWKSIGEGVFKVEVFIED